MCPGIPEFVPEGVPAKQAFAHQGRIFTVKGVRYIVLGLLVSAVSTPEAPSLQRDPRSLDATFLPAFQPSAPPESTPGQQISPAASALPGQRPPIPASVAASTPGRRSEPSKSAEKFLRRRATRRETQRDRASRIGFQPPFDAFVPQAVASTFLHKRNDFPSRHGITITPFSPRLPDAM
jgi:hypothetical protein